jgi:hypothetical protein
LIGRKYTKVTLDQGDQIGRIFANCVVFIFGIFLNKKLSLILVIIFSTEKAILLNLSKFGLGCIWGYFFTTPSGQPALDVRICKSRSHGFVTLDEGHVDQSNGCVSHERCDSSNARTWILGSMVLSMTAARSFRGIFLSSEATSARADSSIRGSPEWPRKLPAADLTLTEFWDRRKRPKDIWWKPGRKPWKEVNNTNTIFDNLEIFPQKIGERLEKRNVKLIFRHINYCIWSQNHIFVYNLLGKNIFTKSKH